MCLKAAIRQGYKYFSTQFANTCWGSNDLAAAVQYGWTTQCNMPCSGDFQMYCGGLGGNSLYRIGPVSADEAASTGVWQLQLYLL